jgi:hypothetical protein
MARLALVRGGAARRAGAHHHAREDRHDQTVRHASRALWGELLEAGVEMYEYQPTMFHCKMVLVDGLLRRWARPTSTRARST